MFLSRVNAISPAKTTFALATASRLLFQTSSEVSSLGLLMRVLSLLNAWHPGSRLERGKDLGLGKRK